MNQNQFAFAQSYEDATRFGVVHPFNTATWTVEPVYNDQDAMLLTSTLNKAYFTNSLKNIEHYGMFMPAPNIEGFNRGHAFMVSPHHYCIGRYDKIIRQGKMEVLYAESWLKMPDYFQQVRLVIFNRGDNDPQGLGSMYFEDDNSTNFSDSAVAPMWLLAVILR